MKTNHLLFFTLLTLCATLLGCNNMADFETANEKPDVNNEYAKYWALKVGLIDPAHTWSTVSAVTALIDMPDDAARVIIYNGNPSEGGHIIGRASHRGKFKIDMPQGAESVYARYVDADNHLLSRGYYPIIDGSVNINGTPKKKQISRGGTEPLTSAHPIPYFDAMLICEDLGSIGDLDFNDIVIGLKHIAGDDPTLIVVPMAAGGIFQAGIFFGDENLGEIHELIEGRYVVDPIILNTQVRSIDIDKCHPIEISLKDPKYNNWNIADNWGDFYLKVYNGEKTINITRPTIGLQPQVICIAGDWFWPQENMNIYTVYPAFADWSCNKGDLTWLGNWNKNLVVKWNKPGENPDDPDDPDEPDNTRMWFRAKTRSGYSSYTLHLNGSATGRRVGSLEVVYVDEPLTSCENMFALYSTQQAFMMFPDGNFMLGNPTVDNGIVEIEFSENFDMSAVRSFAHMFDGCRSLTKVNFDTWIKPTAALTDATAMFHYCDQLTELDLSGWNTSNVGEYFDIFGYCTSLRTLNLDGWQIKSGANLLRFLGNTSGLTVKCSSEVESALRADDTVGGSGTTYTRP